jgi:uncharacterized protein (DUF1800 family)
MVMYLDQQESVGPNSQVAQRRPGRGLNENLARELLELHTLGVGGAYAQDDVRQLAELLAGLTANAVGGTGYNPERGEPGVETVLGVAYGGEAPDKGDIHAALEDLAAHPDTAAHIARKLAVHFVADDPDPDLVEHLRARFVATEGDLPEIHAALLEHPAAQAPALAKAKQPFDYVASALRALGVPGEALLALPDEAMQRWFRAPLAAMGQPWSDPPGPDGWPEEAAAWITPQGMASRITWAAGLRRVEGFDLPDPRAFVQAALGPLAGPRVIFAAEAAESRPDGVAVVLASPEFQRR